MANCKSCGAPLVWGTNLDTGKKIPLNEKSEKRFIRTDRLDSFGLVDTFQTHFATCPDADKFRKPKTKE